MALKHISHRLEVHFWIVAIELMEHSPLVQRCVQNGHAVLTSGQAAMQLTRGVMLSIIGLLLGLALGWLSG